MPHPLGPEPGPRDWEEDFPHENGQYWHQCSECRNMFTGHKRRYTCKLCKQEEKQDDN